MSRYSSEVMTVPSLSIARMHWMVVPPFERRLQSQLTGLARAYGRLLHMEAPARDASPAGAEHQRKLASPVPFGKIDPLDLSAKWDPVWAGAACAGHARQTGTRLLG